MISAPALPSKHDLISRALTELNHACHAVASGMPREAEQHRANAKMWLDLRRVGQEAGVRMTEPTEAGESGSNSVLEVKVINALVAHRGEWFTPGKFKNAIAKRWPEVHNKHDRQPILRVFESLVLRGQINKRPTKSGKAHEYRVA